MKFKVKVEHSGFKAGQIVTGVMILPHGSNNASDLKISIYHRTVNDDGTPTGYWILWPAVNFEPVE